MSAIISGLIGGTVAVVLTAYVAKRVGRSSKPGQLHFGFFMWLLGAGFLAIALLPVLITVLAGHDGELPAKIALFLVGLLGAGFLFAEAAFVRGHYDAQGLQLRSPWTGIRKAAWQDLQSITYSSNFGWYVLHFRACGPIRLSSYLLGHQSALDSAYLATGLRPQS